MLTVKYLYLLVMVLLFIPKLIRSNHVPSVIIVGAGSAGIAAAAKLLENNFTNITIIEAEGRIGGRIYSVTFGDAMVDLGAQFCYGKEGNIVYELVKNLDILRSETLKMTLYHSSYDHGNETLIQDVELYDLFYNIYEEGKKGSEEVSLGEYITGRYNDSIMSRYQDDPEKLKFSFDFLQFFLKRMASQEGAFSPFDVSVKSDFKEDEQNNLFNWNGRGYKTILNVLMKKFAYQRKQHLIDEKIILNKEVTKIVWDKSSKYSHGPFVECLDGSIYTADHIIFTPSLGVLKSSYKTLFYPSLPQDKVTAINDLGVAAFLKVFLQFPTKWWPSSNFTDFSFVWTAKDMELLLQEFPDGPHENDKSWLLDLLTVSAVEGNANVLLASFHGQFVPKIELCSDDTLADGIMFVLNKFVGRYFDNMTEPEAVLRYNWYSNSHFRGTDSFQTVNARNGVVSAEVILAQPLKSSNGKQTLLFAGEATHPIYFSTVHGAIETGYREAERIINFYK